jgi:glutamate dehydrogenase (NAD(P)+)
MSKILTKDQKNKRQISAGNEKEERINPFAQSQAQLNKAAHALKLDPSIHAILLEPERELHVSLPIRMDDGSVKVFQGFRVQYNSTRGPYKGGIRFHPDETIDTIRALAAWMTWKSALLDLPLGGGKGGIICNPKKLSEGELERLSRSYMRHVWQMVGPNQDIPAPDVYTNAQTMAWIMDEYVRIQGRFLPGVITGKPLNLGGSHGREDATGRGGVYIAREAAKYKGMDLSQASVAIQGFGNAGSFAAFLMRELMKSKIVAVSDSQGGIFNGDGLDVEAVFQHKQTTGSVIDYPGTEKLTNEELLELDVDVLFPSGLEDVITSKNAPNIKAKIIIELANGPTTLEADEILFEKGIFVIPDFLSNAGGVTVSYFELVQNLNYDHWTSSDVHLKLDAKMSRAFYDTLEVYKEWENLDMRTAAYIVAIGRIAETMKLRGLPL